MGNKQVKEKNILVLGLSGVGKTHFLDLLQFQGDTTKKPTKGYYTCSVLFDKNTRINLIEYGATSPFNLLHDFDGIFVLIRADYSMEQMLETKSYLLMCCNQIKQKEIPIAILIIGSQHQQQNLDILQLKYLMREKRCCCLCMDFDDVISWQRGCSKLFEWIASN
jgi:hypothetical protein